MVTSRTDDRVVDLSIREHGPHWHRAVGQTLRHCEQVGRDGEAMRGERCAKAAEAGDDLIEDQ